MATRPGLGSGPGRADCADCAAQVPIQVPDHAATRRHGARGQRNREKKIEKGKNSWRVKNNKPRARLQVCICLACLASPFSVLPPVPFPSSAQARSETLAHCTLPRCQLFPPRVLSLAFSLSPGFHSSLPSPPRYSPATAQVGGLVFFVPDPVTSTRHRLASPRRRRPVPRLRWHSSCPAGCVLPLRLLACGLEPCRWHHALYTSLA